jgi:hypothetical protein
MRRIVLLLTVVLILVVTTLALASIASAQSCFSALARSGQPPGELVSGLATKLAGPGEPGSDTDEAARQVGFAKQAIPCPPSS